MRADGNYRPSLCSFLSIAKTFARAAGLGVVPVRKRLVGQVVDFGGSILGEQMVNTRY